MSKKKNPFSIVERPPTTLDYALAYAALPKPWYVFPVWGVDKEGRCRCGRPNNDKGHSAGKHPQSRLCPNGYLDASIDPDILRHWWETDPDAGIGCALSASGLLALDIDRRYNGQEALAKLEERHGKFHSDCVNLTQDRGEHRIFNIESGDTELTFPASIGRGLDIKHHGYICIPPTMGPLGPYHWEEGHSPLSQSNPAVPSRLPDYIRSLSSISYAVPERDGVLVATSQTFEDLRSALKYIDADDYHNWIMVGLCVRAYGESGYNVWAEWSKRSEKFNPIEQRRKWDEDLKPPRAITYRTLFRMAMDAGWENAAATPAKKDAEPAKVESLPPLYSLEDYDLNNIAKPEFLIPDWLPKGYAVLFSGHGGAGKSSIMLQLCLQLAGGCAQLMGQEMLGVPIRVVYISGEDDTTVFLNRTKSILRYLPDLDYRTVVTHFRFFDAAVLKSACLVAFDQRTGKAAETPLYKHLQRLCSDYAPQLIVLDNNSIFFGGNEIDRTQVQTYIFSLLNLHPGATPIALHHMDKASLSREDGEGWSGSTQWHNAVRARWSLSYVDDELTLQLRKSNYGLDGWRAPVEYDKAAGVHVLGLFQHLTKNDERSIRSAKKRGEELTVKQVREEEDRNKLCIELRRFAGSYPSKNTLASAMLTRKDYYWALIGKMVQEGQILELPVPKDVDVPARQSHYLDLPVGGQFSR